jgi:hypothetical protein
VSSITPKQATEGEACFGCSHSVGWGECSGRGGWREQLPISKVRFPIVSPGLLVKCNISTSFEHTCKCRAFSPRPRLFKLGGRIGWPRIIPCARAWSFGVWFQWGLVPTVVVRARGHGGGALAFCQRFGSLCLRVCWGGRVPSSLTRMPSRRSLALRVH